MLFAMLMLSTAGFIPGQVEAEKLLVPTLEDGASFTWSYFFSSPDGSSIREGLQTAQVESTVLNEQDVFLITGTMEGEFVTSESSGDESGEWGGYYLQEDLSLISEWRDLYLEVDGLSVIAGNGSTTSYELPYLQWIQFPLESGSHATSWDEVVISTTTWTHTIDGQVEDQGNAYETYDHRWMCRDEISLKVDAGTFEVHHIKEWVERNLQVVGNSSVYYSDQVGWWVLRERYEPYNEMSVLVERCELVSVGGNRAPVPIPVPRITMEEDTVYTDLDSSDHFSDPDGDALSFGAVDTGDLIVNYDGAMVEIIPPSDRFGTFRFNLTATDNRNPEVKNQVTVQVMPVDDPPELLGGGVDPVAGDTDTVFTYTVVVQDIEGDVPSYVRVYVDDESHPMSKLSGTLIEGAVYGFSMKLDQGDHVYYFLSNDVRLPMTGVFENPEVASPEQPRLLSPSLDTESGNTDSLCTYTVTWKDQGGRYPEDIYLVVDGEDYHAMVKEEGNPQQGASYTAQLFLPEGIHSYHFQAELEGEIIRYPANGALNGPDIFDPVIIEQGHFPLGPEDGEQVTFFIIFRYGHGTTPDVQKLVLDGTEYSLAVSDGDAIDGLNLTRRIQLDAGRHTYRFIIEVDGIDLSTLEGSFDVEAVTSDDDDEVVIDPGEKESPAFFVVVVLLIILGIVGIAAFFLMKYRPPKKPEEDFEEALASEGHVSNIRGL
jgi:hypothetical protein